jgi:hypothetical protein
MHVCMYACVCVCVCVHTHTHNLHNVDVAYSRGGGGGLGSVAPRRHTFCMLGTRKLAAASRSIRALTPRHRDICPRAVWLSTWRFDLACLDRGPQSFGDWTVAQGAYFRILHKILAMSWNGCYCCLRGRYTARARLRSHCPSLHVRHEKRVANNGKGLGEIAPASDMCVCVCVCTYILLPLSLSLSLTHINTHTHTRSLSLSL